MSVQDTHERLWGDFSPQGQPAHCPYAEKFNQWTETLYASVGHAVKQDNASAAVAVNQAKVLLVDRYFEWRMAAPKAHRNRTGEGHICLFHVFDETYRPLRATELSLPPPLLFLPQPSPARLP